MRCENLLRSAGLHNSFFLWTGPEENFITFTGQKRGSPCHYQHLTDKPIFLVTFLIEMGGLFD